MLALLLAAAAACNNHQFDFWLGKWDLVVRSRTSTSEWVESKGRNEITPSYGGCVVEERFTCDTPNGTFAGHSVTAFARGKWHQTWVDNQGAYLVFDGGWTGAEMVLVQEGGQKRMVFTRISPDALHWRWEKTDDGGKTWTPILLIDYRRAG